MASSWLGKIGIGRGERGLGEPELGIRQELGDWDEALAEEAPDEHQQAGPVRTTWLGLRLSAPGPARGGKATTGSDQRPRSTGTKPSKLPDSSPRRRRSSWPKETREGALAAAEEVISLRAEFAGGLATYASGYVAALEAAFALGDRGEGG